MFEDAILHFDIFFQSKMLELILNRPISFKITINYFVENFPRLNESQESNLLTAWSSVSGGEQAVEGGRVAIVARTLQQAGEKRRSRNFAFCRMWLKKIKHFSYRRQTDKQHVVLSYLYFLEESCLMTNQLVNYNKYL